MRRVILAIAASLLGAITAHADIQADARKIQDANQDAVVYLSAVIEIERRGGTREASLETLGTIISERGLIVTANCNLGQTPDSDGNMPKLQDLKVLMPDGDELPATLVLQDVDLDLAFVQIDNTADEVTFKHVTLVEQGPKFELFDHFVMIGRQEEDLERLSSLHVGRVTAVVKRPRLVYGVSGTSEAPHGNPAFNAAGDFVGVFVRKIHQGKLGSLIILPTKAIHKAAQQIAAPVEEKEDAQEEADKNDPDEAIPSETETPEAKL